ncbi:MAG: polymer-forming cytoskeletal protein [Bacteroidales bacterium]|nr:polymer-forming cytoskeletal protein [Bacteroidales bacterium]MCF8390983.1 polymer-forming cytoskeletal protein [Bacteroidales bacterium]
MAKNFEMENPAINLIANGTSIEGSITSNGDIRVDGSLKGTMATKGKVIVGNSGIIKGEVHCKNLEVEGSVDGKVFVEELLSLRSRSKLTGEITTNKLAIEPGAHFTGKCDMTGSKSGNFEKAPVQKSAEEK